MNTVLVVDDEHAVRDSIRMILEYEKYAVRFAQDGRSALEALRGGPADLVLLDIKMPGMDGIEVLQEIRRQWPLVPVIMISGHGTSETASEAARLGAYEFLPKPPDRDRLLILARNAIEVKRLRETGEPGQAIIGESMPIRELRALIDRVAPTESRVLITGDNGTGKELVARAIHRQSPRNTKPLVEVNCAAIPNELIESELFGHEKGSFSGATGQRIGKFELADRGTIFLDEVGDMSPGAQAKVLRALEEGKIERVGGDRHIPVDVRVIAATNKNLQEAIKQNLFREDLFHRLNVIQVHVPPLRERRDDIPVLARAFAQETCARNRMPSKSLADDVVRRLQGMDWSGNVRELRNTVERLVIMTAGPVISADDVERYAGGTRAATDELLSLGGTFQEFKERAEAAFIRKQLEFHSWNITKTAEALDIQRSHLYNKMKKYGLAKEGEEEAS
jgi:two-component system nitrogen regulation response regulator NtrX